MATFLRKRAKRVEQNRPLSKALVFLAAGILISAPIFYAIGYSMGNSSCAARTAKLQEQYHLVSEALQAQLQQNQSLQSRVLYLEDSLKTMSRVLETVYSSVQQVRVSKDLNTITISAQMLYAVPTDFCIPVWVKNKTDRQITLKIGLTGKGVAETARETSIYPDENREIQLCSTITDIVSEAKVVVNGKPVLPVVLISK